MRHARTGRPGWFFGATSRVPGAADSAGRPLCLELCALGVGLCLLGCGAPEPPKAPEPVVEAPPAEPSSTLPLAPKPPVLLRDVGFQSPESALYDPVADVYLVSNVSGEPADADNDGFISKVSPEGALLELRWIDAAKAKTELNAPKGMALVGETLFVADIDVVRAFDRSSGKALGDVAIPSATFLNDLAAGPNGNLYVSDTGVGKSSSAKGKGAPELSPNGSDAVYVIDAQRSVRELAKNPELERPNGLVAHKGNVWVAAASGEVYSLDGKGVKTLLGKPAGGLDGLVLTPGGRLLVSSWEASTVFIAAAAPAASGGETTFEPLITDLSSPADLGYDVKRRQLIVPLLRENALYIQELPGDVN